LQENVTNTEPFSNI